MFVFKQHCLLLDLILFLFFRFSFSSIHQEFYGKYM